MSAMPMAVRCALLCLIGFSAAAYAQNDAEGCKDHPLFSRLPNFHIADCESSQSELKRFPVGPTTKDEKGTALEEVRGPYLRIHYVPNDGAAKPGAKEMLHDFVAAATQGGGVVMGEYPGSCKTLLDSSMRSADGCINHGATVRMTTAGKEVWAFMQSTKDGPGYELRIVEREAARKADAVANEMLEKIIKEGFVTVHINFDFAKASIKQDSIPIIVQIVEMLKLAPDLNIEVAGHTDNVGGAQLNQDLSEARSESVVRTLIECGVPASRLVAKGYGQSKPVADNRTAEGRAKNRRVELRKIKP